MCQNIFLSLIKVGLAKFNEEMMVDRGAVSNCSSSCEAASDVSLVSRCFIGNYTNSIAVGTWAFGNFTLLSPFDQINQPNIQDCKG